jgi:hypothetical protein
LWNSLESHAALAQILIALILAGITAYYAYLTRRILSETRRMQRPYVVVDLQPSIGHHLEVSVSNTGERVAHRIEFKIDRDFADGRGGILSDYVPFVKGIHSLAPHQTHSYFVETDAGLWERPDAQLMFGLTVSYWSGVEHFVEPVELDLTAHKGRLIRSLVNPHPI